MLVTQFPKEMENDYSKIHLKDTPAAKRRLLMQIQPEASPQPVCPLSDETPGLRHQGWGRRGEVAGGEAGGSRAGEAGDDSWQRDANGRRKNRDLKADPSIPTALKEARPWPQRHRDLGGAGLEATPVGLICITLTTI